MAGPQDNDPIQTSTEEWLQLALSFADMGLWDWDILSGKITWSATLERLWGFEPGTFPGTYEAYASRIPPEEFAKMEVSLKRALAERTDHIVEHRVILPSGEMRWIHGRGRVRFDALGRPVRMTGISIDITDRKRTSEEFERLFLARSAELTKSHAFLDSLIENLPNMVFVKDAQNLRFVRFNRAGERLLGYSREDLLGKNDYDFFPKAQADFFTEKDRAVLSGQAIVDIPEEYIQTRDKGLRVLHTKKIPVFGPDGKPEYLLGISDDITEVKRSEEQRLRLVHEKAQREEADRALKRTRLLAEASACMGASLNYLQTLKNLARIVLDDLADWCTITMRNEVTGAIERVACEHVDPSKQHFVDELREKYMPSADQAPSVAAVIRAGKSFLTPVVPEDMMRNAAQNERHFEVMMGLGCYSCIIVPIVMREEVIGAISLVRGKESPIYTADDLSVAEELGRRAGIFIENARLYEKAQRAIELRGEFLSIASHELKTPITSLKLQLQMAHRRLSQGGETVPPPEKLREILDTSLKQVDRLTGLIENLLDVSRIEAGKLIYTYKDEDLGAIVGEVVERHREQFAAAQSGVELQLAHGVLVSCDRFRAEQVVVNLLSNALKYGMGKPIQVRVYADDNRARLEVQDQGMGIDPSQQERIFERFERAISSSNISGLGLGLYISREIVNSHGGTIRVQSEPGQGATFIVELPLSGGRVVPILRGK